MDMNTEKTDARLARAIDLLRRLVEIPSYSRDEAKAADFFEDVMRRDGLRPQRCGHNLWVCGTMREERPTLLLNAHLDTVRPVNGWTLPPHVATVRDGRLYGLGSNDCGGGLVTLYLTFLALHDRTDLPWNLVFAASAEEEVSGRDGMERLRDELPPIDVAIVGEPTGMQPAIAEKGLMVLDAVAHGRAGHAAREEGVNAIYAALPDLEWIRTHRFSRISPLLGPVKMSVTIIQAGTQHNVVPDTCRFTIDVRPNDCYTNREILDEIRENLHSDVTPRSTRLNASHLAPEHPLVQRAVVLGRTPFGSPTLSDQALMPFPSMKMGPGDSARSHTADEYIRIDELNEALRLYPELILGTRQK